MRVVLSVMVIMAGLAHPALAAPTDVEKAYLDLVYGHCFAGVAGKTIGENRPDPTRWEQVEKFDVSEPEMEGAKGHVDLRYQSFGASEILVDLENKEVCWTQMVGPQAGNMAARLRLSVIDGQFGGQLLEERFEQGVNGQLSRVSTYGLTHWDEQLIPVIIVREILGSDPGAITTQVIIGQKNSQ